MKLQKIIGLTLLTLAMTGATVGAASAATNWQRHHPRRAEVNHRLARQNARIHEERKEGEITGAQAASLHAQDHTIRTEERAMAAQDNGHITRAGQKSLNQQLNGVSGQIPH